MVNLFEASEAIKDYLISKASYLGIASDKIEEGIVGESENEVFNVTDSFIRIYVQQQPDNSSFDGFQKNRLGSLVVICGMAGVNLVETSKECYKLAERIERALLESGMNISKEQEPIFTLKNGEGISIFAIPFYFIYESSASDPNG